MKRTLISAVRRGLTLLELVVVLAILAVVSAMIVPKLDFFQKQAEHVTGAATAADLTTALQTYKTSTGVFPPMDLLVTETGEQFEKLWKTSASSTTYTFTATALPLTQGQRWYSSLLDGGLTSGFVNVSVNPNASDSDLKFTVTTPPGEGETDPTITDYGTSAVDLINGVAAGTQKLAVLNPSSTYSQELIKACFPETGAVPSNALLVGFGLGPRCPLFGSLIESAPLSTQGDNPASVYCRYVAVFAVYSNGTPAKLKAIVDHRTKRIVKRLDQYKTTGPST